MELGVGKDRRGGVVVRHTQQCQRSGLIGGEVAFVGHLFHQIAALEMAQLGGQFENPLSLGEVSGDLQSSGLEVETVQYGVAEIDAPYDLHAVHGL